jgi:TolA-binding protein
MLLGVSVILTAGCRETISPRARQDLDASAAAYRSGDYDLAVDRANTVLAENPKGEAAWEAYYLRGMARYKQESFDAARADLRIALDETDQDSLAIKAGDALGEIAYRQDDLIAARQLFQDVIDRGEDRAPPLDHANYRLGCIYQRRSQWDEADLHFQRVIYHFPGTELARLASQRSGARHWTVQVGSYEDRDNAAAAARLFPVSGPRAFVEPIIRDGEPAFLLMVGKWKEYDRAEAALPDVRETRPDAFLTVVR